MKILLLGANGQVGFELMRSLSALGALVCATRDGLLSGGMICAKANLADPESLAAALDTASADIVVNAAAYTAVDRAEDELDLADRVNHRALAEIGAWAARRKALVVHYSTDYVFDGQGKRPYREDDPTAPLSAYGRSKLAGEIALRDAGCEHLILRTAWVYAARGQNFLRTMLRLANERERLTIVNDQHGAPMSSRLIATATTIVLARWVALSPEQRTAASGIYHLCTTGQCSWFEFANRIFELASSAGVLKRVPEVVPITTAQYPTRARRPAYSVLDATKLCTTFGLHLPPWEQGLMATLGELAEMHAQPLMQ